LQRSVASRAQANRSLRPWLIRFPWDLLSSLLIPLPRQASSLQNQSQSQNQNQNQNQHLNLNLNQFPSQHQNQFPSQHQFPSLGPSPLRRYHLNQNQN
jgi:hypothetical protein